MKMQNGRLPTWYVIKRITADCHLRATASSTEHWVKMTAANESNDSVVFRDAEDQWLVSTPLRDDWTLRRVARVIGLGKITRINKATSWSPVTSYRLSNLPDGEYVLSARKA